MEFNIPLHPKKKKCIICGSAVGSKGKSHIKKAISVGMEKSIEFWTKQHLIVHHHEHKICSSCVNFQTMEEIYWLIAAVRLVQEL